MEAVRENFEKKFAHALLNDFLAAVNWQNAVLNC